MADLALRKIQTDLSIVHLSRFEPISGQMKITLDAKPQKNSGVMNTFNFAPRCVVKISYSGFMSHLYLESIGPWGSPVIRINLCFALDQP